MTSAPVRDPLAGHLLTPQNAAFLFVDYQPAQLATVRSIPRCPDEIWADEVLLGPNALERSCVHLQNGDCHV